MSLDARWRIDGESGMNNVAARRRWRRCDSAAACWASDVTCMRISWSRSACACLLAMLSMPDIGRGFSLLIREHYASCREQPSPGH